MKLLLLSLISSYLLSFVIMTNAGSEEIRPNPIIPNENQGSRSCPNVAGSQCGGTPTGESQVPYTGETCCPDGYVCVGSEYWKGCQLETAPTKPDYCPSDNYCIGKLDDNYEIAPNKNWYIACSGGVTYCMPCASVHAGEPELVYKKYSDDGERLDMCIWPAGSPGEEYNNIDGSSTNSNNAGLEEVTGVRPNGKESGNGNGCPNPPYEQCGGKRADGTPFTGPTCCPDGYFCKAHSEWYSNCRPESERPRQPDYCPTPGDEIDNWCKGKFDGNYEIAPNKNWYIACSGGVTYCMPCASVHSWQPELVFNEARDECIWPAGSLYERYNNPSGTGLAPAPLPALLTRRSDESKKGIRRR